MVHQGLDYTCTWHLEKLCILIEVGFDPMYGYLKQWYYNPKLYELGWCLAILFGMQQTWYGHSGISNSFAMCAFWAILCLFYFFLPITPPIWQMFQVLLVYFDYMHIWKVSGCSNRGPMPFFDVVAAYFLLVLLGMEIWHVGQNPMFVFWRQE